MSKYIFRIATFAWQHSPSILYDEFLENTLSKISSRLILKEHHSPISLQTKENLPIVLHIATRIFKSGGHSRIILNWINTDVKRDNRLVLTSQKDDLPNIFNSITSEISLLDPSLNTLERSRKLRKLVVYNNIKTIIIHQHPNDVVPTIALDKIKSAINILYYNHADHVFWIGTSISSSVINFRKNSINISRQFRKISSSKYLPFILKEKIKFKAKDILKTQMGFGRYKKILISTASTYKYLPFEGMDFFNFYENFLRSHPEICLIVLGVNNTAYKNNFGRNNNLENLQLLGTQAFPEKYYHISDVFVESFPLGSFLALTDVLLYDSIPLFSYQKSITVVNEESLSILPESFRKYKAHNLKDYEDRLLKSLLDYNYQSEILKEVHSFIENHSTENTLNHIDKLYVYRQQEIDLNDQNQTLNYDKYNDFINPDINKVIENGLNTLVRPISLFSFVKLLKLTTVFNKNQLSLYRKIFNLSRFKIT